MAPKIHALTVCVRYADHLAVTLPYWMVSCDTLTIVTSPEDMQIGPICREALIAFFAVYQRTYPLTLVRTDAFTRHGAFFNKGLAMEEARAHMPWQDWILFFDADIQPPLNWHRLLPELQMGYLYGCTRLDSKTKRPLDDDRVGYGYFQLFHAKDPKVQRTPLLDTHWTHAGNADSNFLLSFRNMVRTLPFPVLHLGAKHENWFGIGHEEEFRRMMETRGGHGIHPSEKV